MFRKLRGLALTILMTLIVLCVIGIAPTLESLVDPIPEAAVPWIVFTGCPLIIWGAVVWLKKTRQAMAQANENEEPRLIVIHIHPDARPTPPGLYQ